MTFSQTSDSCDKAGQWSYNSSFVLTMCACLWVRKNHCSAAGCPRGSELQGEHSAGWAKARSRARLPAPLKLPGVMLAPHLLVLGGMGITPRIHETLKWREAWSPWMMSLDDVPDPFLVPDVLGWCLWLFAGQMSVDLLWTSCHSLRTSIAHWWVCILTHVGNIDLSKSHKKSWAAPDNEQKELMNQLGLRAGGQEAQGLCLLPHLHPPSICWLSRVAGTQGICSHCCPPLYENVSAPSVKGGMKENCTLRAFIFLLIKLTRK